MKALSASLQNVKGVKNVTGFTQQSKQAVVEYNPQATSVQQLADAVAKTNGLHGKPYEASLLLHVNDLSNPDTQKKIDTALKDVKGVHSAAVVDAQKGLVGIQFDKLEAEPGVRLNRIVRTLRQAGVTAQAYVPPAS